MRHVPDASGDSLLSFVRDVVTPGTEAKCVTSRWFNEVDKKETKISTWEGTITRK